MEKFIKGDVVVVPFPFSDLTGSKLRPALLLAKLSGNDFLLCQITSKPAEDSISLTNDKFISGSLPVNSFIRPSKLFTADQNIFIKKAAHIDGKLVNTVTKQIIALLNQK
jgi:mRNA interferase MazF